MKKYCLLLVFCIFLVGETVAEAAWRVYERVSPRPASRNDWFTVAQDLPMGGVGEGWQLADQTPYATYAEAAAAADAARISDRFSSICDRDYNVYYNVSTRGLSVKRASDTAPAGEGFQIYRTGLCCEDAFDLAFGPLVGTAGVSPSDCRVVRQQSVAGLIVQGPQGWMSLTNGPVPKGGKKGKQVVDDPALTGRPLGPDETTWTQTRPPGQPPYDTADRPDSYSRPSVPPDRPSAQGLPAGLKPEDEVWVSSGPELKHTDMFVSAGATSCTTKGSGEFKDETVMIRWDSPPLVLRPGDKISLSITAQQNKHVAMSAGFATDGYAAWKVDGPPRESYWVQTHSCGNLPHSLCRHQDRYSATLDNARGEFFIYAYCNGPVQMASVWKYNKMKAAEIPQKVLSAMGVSGQAVSGAPENPKPEEDRPYTYILKDGKPFKSFLKPGEMAEMKVKCGEFLHAIKTYAELRDKKLGTYDQTFWDMYDIWGKKTASAANYDDAISAAIYTTIKAAANYMTGFEAMAKCGAYLSVDRPARREAGPQAGVSWQFSIDKGPLRIATEDYDAVSEIRTPVGVVQAEGPAEYTVFHDPDTGKSAVVSQRGTLSLVADYESGERIFLKPMQAAVISAGGIKTASASTDYGAYGSRSASVRSFHWIDKNSDKVGQWGNGRPDGTPDGHFALVIDMPEQKEISSIAVYSADGSGIPAGGQVWHTKRNQHWMLGVFHQGSQIIQSHTQSLGRFSGTVRFDLYCNDSGWFKNGQTFLVELEFGDGSKTGKTVRLVMR